MVVWGFFAFLCEKKWMQSISFTWHNIKHMKIIYFQTVSIYLAITSFICETVTPPSRVLGVGNCKYEWYSEAVILKCCLQRNWILRKKLWVCQNWEWGDAAQISTTITLKHFRIQIQAPYMPLLWTPQLVRRLQASNRKLFACMPEPQLWFSRVNPDLSCIQGRLHHLRNLLYLQ